MDPEEAGRRWAENERSAQAEAQAIRDFDVQQGIELHNDPYWFVSRHYNARPPGNMQSYWWSLADNFTGGLARTARAKIGWNDSQLGIDYESQTYRTGPWHVAAVTYAASFGVGGLFGAGLTGLSRATLASSAYLGATQSGLNIGSGHGSWSDYANLSVVAAPHLIPPVLDRAAVFYVARSDIRTTAQIARIAAEVGEDGDVRGFTHADLNPYLETYPFEVGGSTTARYLAPRTPLAKWSRTWLNARNKVVLYRGQTVRTRSILSRAARSVKPAEAGIALSQRLTDRLVDYFTTDGVFDHEEFAAVVGRKASLYHGARLRGGQTLPGFEGERIGGVVLPATAQPGIARAFAGAGRGGGIYVMAFDARRFRVFPVDFNPSPMSLELEYSVLNTVHKNEIMFLVDKRAVMGLEVGDTPTTNNRLVPFTLGQ